MKKSAGPTLLTVTLILATPLAALAWGGRPVSSTQSGAKRSTVREEMAPDGGREVARPDMDFFRHLRALELTRKQWHQVRVIINRYEKTTGVLRVEMRRRNVEAGERNPLRENSQVSVEELQASIQQATEQMHEEVTALLETKQRERLEQLKGQQGKRRERPAPSPPAGRRQRP